MTTPAALWLATIVATLAAGYALGRIRPYERLADWTNWQLRFHLDRWTSRPRQFALFGLLLVTDTTRTLRAWRRRHDGKETR